MDHGNAFCSNSREKALSKYGHFGAINDLDK